MDMFFFELKPEHLTLMRELSFQATNFSAYGYYLTPVIDTKRPFGNSDVLGDVCSLIGCQADGDGYYEVADLKRAVILLAELPLAIKYVINTQNFTPGKYILDKNGFASHEIFWQKMAYGYAMMFEAFHEAKAQGVIPRITEDDRLYSAAFNNIGFHDPFEGVMRVLEYVADDTFLASTSNQPESERQEMTKMHEDYKKALGIFSKYHEQYLKEKSDSFDAAINRFDGEYSFLSNFFECLVSAHNVCYLNSEAAFQAQKCVTEEDRLAFCELSARDAKKAGRKVNLRSDWEGVKDEEMFLILRNKFSNPQLANKLLATGDRELIEGNYWHDNYWGNCTCAKCHHVEGKNKLGQMLMVIRDEKRREKREVM